MAELQQAGMLVSPLNGESVNTEFDLSKSCETSLLTETDSRECMDTVNDGTKNNCEALGNDMNYSSSLKEQASSGDPNTDQPVVNGTDLETCSIAESSSTQEYNCVNPSHVDRDMNSNAVKNTIDIQLSEVHGNAPPTGASGKDDVLEAKNTDKCLDKQDINGNSTSEQDNNLIKEERESQPASPEPTPETPKADSATPVKRKTATPCNLPLAVNGSRKSSSLNSSPSSPTQKTISETRRKPASPGPPSYGGSKPDIASTPKKDRKSPNGEKKFVFKRQSSKSKLPVASPQTPDTPKVNTPTSEKRSEDVQTPQNKPDPNDVSSSVKSTPNQSAVSTPVKDNPTPSIPVTSTPVSKEAASLSMTPNVPSTPKTDVMAKSSIAAHRRTQENDAWAEKVKQFQELKMAMSELNQDPRTRFLRCLFCTHLFTLNGREPRMLACCLNAICSACASRLCLETPLHLRCPVCRQNIALPQDKTSDSIDLTDESVVDLGLLGDLPIEIVRKKIIEFQHIQKGLTFPCSYCMGKTMSTWFCENCDDYMCDNCREQHKEETKTKRHSTIAIPTLKSRQLRDFKQHHYCKEHSFSKLTLYCTTCKQVICSTCTRDGHERDTHTVLTIQEAFGVKVKQAGKLLTKARKKHRHLTDYAKCLKAKSDCNEVSSDSARDIINETFDRLMDVMQHRRTELLAEVERESARLATSATVDTDSADCRLSMINTATEYTKEFKSKADAVEFLQLFPTVTDTLRGVLDFSNDQVNTSRQGVVFSPWNLNVVETLLKTAGQLRVVTYKPTGRPGREEVQLKPALHPEGHDLDTMTTMPDGAGRGRLRDVVGCPDNRLIMIPATEERDDVVINCPRLNFDLQTVHSDRTITSEGAMINHAPERPLPKTGCRLRSYPGAVASTALDGTGFHLWMVKTKVHVKQRVPDNKMLFEAAITGTPVDAPLSQRIDSSLVLAGCDLHHELCIKAKYCCKNLAHLSGCKNAAGTNADFQFGMLLDFDRRRLHVLDLSKNVVIAKAERISIHKPLWSIFCVGRFTFADVKMKLDTADKVKVTPELFQLLKGIVDQERSK